MVELSAGQKLNRARLARNISVEAAAHAIKMRPDRIRALENDDYVRFGGNAYAKSFLLMYGRFLGLDLTKDVKELAKHERVNVAEYQYLNNAADPAASAQERAVSRLRERRPPSLKPLVAFMGVCFVAIFVMYYKVQERRLGLDKPQEPEAVQIEPSQPLATPAAPVQPPAQALPVVQPPVETPAPVEGVPQMTAESTLPNRAKAIEPSGNTNELILEPLRKTYVKIRKDSQDSPVIFEDYLYPGAGSLKLRGTRFFVEVRDETAVQIRSNGRPIAYQSPGISIP